MKMCTRPGNEVAMRNEKGQGKRHDGHRGGQAAWAGGGQGPQVSGKALMSSCPGTRASCNT